MTGLDLRWPYRFVPSTRDPATRRAILDSTGTFVTLMSVIFVLVVAAYSLWTASAAAPDGSGSRGKPPSPATRSMAGKQPARPPHLLRVPVNRRLAVALTGSKESLGSILLAATWTLLVLYMVQWDTSDDYLHITRSPAQVASALIMSNVILSLPPSRTSAPQILSLHRLQSLLIFGLMILHAVLYVNFYVRKGILSKRIRDVDVQLGVGLLGLAGALWYSGARITALRAKWGLRQARYLHVLLTLLMAAMLWFHVAHARVHVLRAAAVLAVGQAWRAWQASIRSSPARKRAQ